VGGVALGWGEGWRVGWPVVTFDIDRIRAQFPALALADDGQPRVYLDNPAGTQVPQQVIDRMVDCLVRTNANMGGQFRTTIDATELVHQAHLAMADFYHANSEREIVFGANMTSLTFQMTRSLGTLFQPGDEMIITAMEHDGNNTPWRLMAAERGMVVKTLPFDPHTYEFDLAALDALITERTRFAALNMASNLLGTINPIKEMCARLRAAGAITYIDAVQYAPHGPVDVQDLGCDFLVSSAYKWYGPHQGVLWGREELLQTLPVWKLEAAGNDSPNRWETGTQSHEGQAGCIGAIEYLQWVGREFGDDYRHLAPAGSSERTADIHAAMRAMAAYEEQLSERLITGLRAIDGVEIRGITNLERLSQRVPTVSFTRDGLDNAAMAKHLAAHNVYVWNGHNYALPVVDFLGIREQGAVRVGPTHYNSLDEVDLLVELVGDYLRAN